MTKSDTVQVFLQEVPTITGKYYITHPNAI